MNQNKSLINVQDEACHPLHGSPEMSTFHKHENQVQIQLNVHYTYDCTTSVSKVCGSSGSSSGMDLRSPLPATTLTSEQVAPRTW